MANRYLDSIRNPQPYPTSDTSNPPSRARTPVSGSEYHRPKRTPGQSPSQPPSQPPSQAPSRARTPASVFELTNPKPYPTPTPSYSYDNPVVKPTAVRASPQKPAKSYHQNDVDKPKSKKLTKTKSTPRAGSSPGTPTASDVEYRDPADTPRNGPAHGTSLTSLDLALKTDVKKESAFDVEAGPVPAPRTTSIDGYNRTSPTPYHKDAVDAFGSKPINTTKSSHPMTAREKRDEQFRAGLVFFIVVIFFAIGLGLGLSGNGGGNNFGIFSGGLGQDCRFSCRNRASFTNRAKSPLIVFAIDGLPSEVMKGGELAPNIKRLSECGVHSHDMIPSFASTTFPNLWTILTGRYPQSHGVYSDYMIGSLGRVFEPRVSEDNLEEPDWYKAKPLWQTAREQGVITASHSVVGNAIKIEENDYRQPINMQPNYYQEYDSQLTPQDMVDTVMKWIQQEDVTKIPQFITVFFREPGNTIRQYGHYSQIANDTMTEIDLAIGSLLDYLVGNQDGNCFNIIVTSPAGLVTTSCGGNDFSNVRFLDQEIASLSDLSMTPDYLNSFARISIDNPFSDYNSDDLVEDLKCRFTDKGSVYTRAELPARFHYSSHNLPDSAYVLMKDGQSFGMEFGDYISSYCEFASDGYDPSGVESSAVFIGFGPNFKDNYEAQEFYTMDVYNLMTDLLGVTAEPNNGTMGALRSMLSSGGSETPTPSIQSQWGSCPYDSSRLMADYKTGCTCLPGAVGDADADDRGAAVFDTQASSAERHIPFGSPLLYTSPNQDSASSCLLYQDSYVLNFDTALTIGKYVSFTLASGYSTVNVQEDCVLTDTRLDIGQNPSCLAYTDPTAVLSLAPDVTMAFLLQPAMSVGSSDAGLISSNMLPLYLKFETEIWAPLVTSYRSWSDLFNTDDLNIVQGPIYDVDNDGIADDLAQISASESWAGLTAVPTHFYIVATRCANNSALSTCAPEELEVQAFILPHNNKGLPCQSSMTLDDYLMDCRASLGDVEMLTGLVFFPDWSTSSDVNIRDTIMHMKMQVPYTLWMN